MAKKVFTDSQRGHGFKYRVVYPELRKNGVFSSSLGFKYLNIFFLNDNGSQLRKKFKRQLKEYDQKLPRYVQFNQQEAIKTINTLGSNILLLDCFNDELIEQLKPLFGEPGTAFRSPMDDSSFDQLDSFDFLFYSFLDSIDSFDSFDSSFNFGSSDFAGVDFGGGDFGAVYFRIR